MALHDRRPGDTALISASWARTALDDPMGVPDEDLPETDHRFVDVTSRHIMYAIDRIDDLFEALDPPLETRETLSRALTEAGMILASIHETITLNAADDEPDGAYDAADRRLALAMDSIDEAISALTPEEDDA